MQTVNPKVTVRSKRSTRRSRKNRKRPAKVSSTNQSGRSRIGINIPSCTRLYALALTDPWELLNFPTLPCYIDGLVSASYKLNCRSRGTFSVGTAGVGFLIVYPGMQVNDTAVAIGSGAAYTGTTMVYTGVGTAPLYNDSPYTASSFAVAVASARLVGCGVRIRYIGTELARGGRVCLARKQDNSSWVTGTSLTNLLSERSVQTLPITKQWSTLTWKPVSSENADYGADLGSSMAVIIDGATAGNGFEFDIVQYFEIHAKTGLPNMTVSESDPLGHAAIQSALPAVESTLKPWEAFTSLLQRIGQYASHSMTGPVLEGVGATIGSFVQASALRNAKKSLLMLTN